MVTTLDARPALVQARAHEQDRLALHIVARHAICGCVNCHDELRGEELDYLIRLTQARIRGLGDAIIEATRPPDASTSNGL